MAKVSFEDYRRRAYLLNFGCGVIFLLTLATPYSPLGWDSDEPDYVQHVLLGMAVAPVAFWILPVSAIYCSLRARRDPVLLAVGCVGLVMFIAWLSSPIGVPFNWVDKWYVATRWTSCAYTAAALMNVFGYRFRSAGSVECERAS